MTESAWRVGGKVPLNVYEGDRPMFQCHTPEDAARIVALLNASQQVHPDTERLEREAREACAAIRHALQFLEGDGDGHLDSCLASCRKVLSYEPTIAARRKTQQAPAGQTAPKSDSQLLNDLQSDNNQQTAPNAQPPAESVAFNLNWLECPICDGYLTPHRKSTSENTNPSAPTTSRDATQQVKRHE